MVAKKPKELTQYGTPLSDEWNTPQEIADLVGEVDWDPFSNAKSTIKAKKRGGLDIGLDGFDLANWPNVGKLVAFANFPFSQGERSVDVVMAWLDGAYNQRSITVIHKADLSTKWFRKLSGNGHSHRMLTPPKRINFVSDRGTSSNFCSVVSCLGPNWDFEIKAGMAGWRTFK